MICPECDSPVTFTGTQAGLDWGWCYSCEMELPINPEGVGNNNGVVPSQAGAFHFNRQKPTEVKDNEFNQ